MQASRAPPLVLPAQTAGAASPRTWTALLAPSPCGLQARARARAGGAGRPRPNDTGFSGGGPPSLPEASG
eukprot:565399-Alexandrium_andersonii.AAC.1